MKKTINEELARMRVMAGIKPQPETLQEAEERLIAEGMLANIAAGLGLALTTFTGALGQTNLDKLKYSQDKKEAIEQAMENPEVQAKLKELGVEDNNIDKQIKRLKGKRIMGYEKRTVYSDKDLQRYLKLGYHLTSVDRDTLIKTLVEKAPEKPVETIQLKMDEETMFASGKFQLNNVDVENIKSVLDSVEQSNSVLLNVYIVSSTDKQPISPRLQNTLKSLGYSPDNKGLSEARSNGVEVVLKSMGIDSSIVNKKTLFEQGSPTIDQSARYVTVLFDVVHIETPVTPEDKITTTQEIKSVYNLVKPKVKKHKHFSLGICKTNAGHYHPKHTAVDKCFFPAPPEE